MEILLFIVEQFLGKNVVNYFTPRYMCSLKFAKCLLLPAYMLFHGLEFVT